MRVTQSMLSNTMLRNLNSSYNRMAVLQEQISTGSKLLRPSDDPVGTTKAMSYRTQLQQNQQYQDNLDTATKWLDMSDDALGQITNAMTRVQELVTQAANDTNQTIDREKMLVEIQQIREEVKDIANTKVGDNYIFSGTRTNEPVYLNATVDMTTYVDANNNPVESLELYTQKDNSTIATARDKDGELVAKVTNNVVQKVADNATPTTVATLLSTTATSTVLTPSANLGINTVVNNENPGEVTTILTDNDYAPNTLTISNDGTATSITNANGDTIAKIAADGTITDQNDQPLTATSGALQLDLYRTLNIDATGNVVITNSDNNSEITIQPNASVMYKTAEGTTIDSSNTGELTLNTPTQTEIKSDATGKVNIKNNDTTNNYGEKKESADKKIAQNITGMDQSANVEIYNDIQLGVTSTGAQLMFAKLDTVFAKVEAALTGDVNDETSHDKLTVLLGGTNSAADRANETIQGVVDLVLKERSQVGAKQNRVDMMADRLALQKETLTKQQSNVEDVEYEEAITNLITQESIHNAALSVGGKIIQQTLVDFIR
ncbi:flagellar hook-associated protein FlgL [Kurthia massiliensis]|uniref:flagellar hook-associated protein FlgL n=1 Tax=Kurthia massiliensis TaxID=1033739 RepID=UPI0002891297|nr:flagellar hook-associated protein FlgL [Kurthia massiliensis]